MTLPPATTEAAESVLVTRRSADFVTVSVSVAELFVVEGSVVPVGAVIDAVFATVPFAAALNVAVIV